MTLRTRLIRWGCTTSALVLLMGCGFPEQRSASPIPDDQLPTALRAEPKDVPPTSPSGSEPATIWFVDGDRLVPVRHDVVAPASVESVTTDLLGGPAEAELEQGLRSALPDPSVLNAVDLAQGVATVDLAAPFGAISPDDQLLAIGQFVLTLTDARGVGRVQFEVDGNEIPIPLPSGETSNLPVFREQYLDLAVS